MAAATASETKSTNTGSKAVVTTTALASMPNWVRAPMHSISLRLAPGQILKPVLHELAKQAGAQAYCILTCVGSVRDISIRTANSKTVLHLTTPHEITSLVGTFNATSGGHLHVTVSDNVGACVGGHLMDGGTAFTTIELVIGVIDGVSYDRTYCAASTYDELNPQRTEQQQQCCTPATATATATASTASAAAAPSPDNLTAQQIIAHYQLDGHEEGGYYKRIYATDFKLSKDLPPAYSRAGFSSDSAAVANPSRLAGSAILYMLTSGQVSKLHILKADECWQFLSGEPLTVVEADPTTKKLIRTVLGRNILNGEKLFYTVKANRFFGAYANPGTRYGLVSCTLTPEWHFEDFEFGKRSKLIAEFGASDADAKALIERLTDDDTAAAAHAKK